MGIMVAVLVVEDAPVEQVRIVEVAEDEKVYFILHARPQDVPKITEDIKPDLLLVNKQVHPMCDHLYTQPSLSDVPIVLCKTSLNLDVLRVLLAALASEGD